MTDLDAALAFADAQVDQSLEWLAST